MFSIAGDGWQADTLYPRATPGQEAGLLALARTWAPATTN
jgi:hypothetical protein